jgi:hypothetical protein
VFSHKHELEMNSEEVEGSLTIIKSDWYESEELVYLATNGDDQVSFGQIPIEISMGSPQFADFQTKGNCSNHEELDFHRSSIFKKEQQKDYLSPYVPFVSIFYGKVDDDEEEGDVISNLFRSLIADNSLHKYSSLPLGFYPDVPIFDKYSDDEEEFKVYEALLTNGITSSSTFKQRDDQQCMHAMVDDSYESVVQNSNKDPLTFYSSFKDIIIGESNQQFSHDIFLKTHPSFDHSRDIDVEHQEHISSFLSEIVNSYGKAHHSDGSESQGYSKGEDIHEQSMILNLYDGDHGFEDPMVDLLESYLSDSLNFSDFIISLAFVSEYDLLK